MSFTYAVYGLEFSLSIIKNQMLQGRGKIYWTPFLITAGEFSLDVGDSADSAHFEMFTRLGEPLSRPFDNHPSKYTGLLPSTSALLEGIKHNFSDLYLGVGCLSAIEEMAYDIVHMMDNYFRPMKDENGMPLYTDYHLEYIDLHLKIEPMHDRMMWDFIDKIESNEGQRSRINDGRQEIKRLMIEFWDSLANITNDPSIIPTWSNNS